MTTYEMSADVPNDLCWQAVSSLCTGHVPCPLNVKAPLDYRASQIRVAKTCNCCYS